MTFQVFSPHPFLSRIFRSYIVQQGYCAQEVSTVLSAKGVGAIMFSFGHSSSTQLLHHADGLTGEMGTQGILLGTSSVSNRATYVGPINLLIFVLQATGIYHFLRADSSQVTNCASSLESLHLPGLFQEVQERLLGIKEVEKAVRLLESYFLHYFSTVAPPNWQHDLAPVVDHIEHCQGQVPIQLLAKKFRVTPRALEKSFLRQVGTSPKEFSRVMRFKATMQHIAAFPGTTWLDVVARFNYTDQSHLIREFQQFAGHTPARLFAQQVTIDQQLYLRMSARQGSHLYNASNDQAPDFCSKKQQVQ